jgi:hypothetical protein
MRGIWGDKCPDAVTTRDDAELLELGKRFSWSRGDIVTLAQLSFEGSIPLSRASLPALMPERISRTT